MARRDVAQELQEPGCAPRAATSIATHQLAGDGSSDLERARHRHAAAGAAALEVEALAATLVLDVAGDLGPARLGGDAALVLNVAPPGGGARTASTRGRIWQEESHFGSSF